MGSGVLYPDFQADGSQLFPYLKISLSLRGLPGKAKLYRRFPFFSVCQCLRPGKTWRLGMILLPGFQDIWRHLLSHVWKLMLVVGWDLIWNTYAVARSHDLSYSSSLDVTAWYMHFKSYHPKRIKQECLVLYVLVLELTYHQFFCALVISSHKSPLCFRGVRV